MASPQNLAGLAALAALGMGVYKQSQAGQSDQPNLPSPTQGPQPSSNPLSSPMYSDYDDPTGATGLGQAGNTTVVRPGRAMLTTPTQYQAPSTAAQTQQVPVARATPNQMEIADNAAYRNAIAQRDARIAPPLPVKEVTQSYTRTQGGPTAEELEQYRKDQEAAKSSKKVDKTKYTMKELSKDPMLKEAAAHMLPGGAGLKGIAALARAMAKSPGSKDKEYYPHELTPQIGMEPLKIGSEPAKLAMKKGGTVKKMAKGGVSKINKPSKVSKASSRGDGIAMKGKTKGRFI